MFIWVNDFMKHRKTACHANRTPNFVTVFIEAFKVNQVTGRLLYICRCTKS